MIRGSGRIILDMTFIVSPSRPDVKSFFSILFDFFLILAQNFRFHFLSIGFFFALHLSKAVLKFDVYI